MCQPVDGLAELLHVAADHGDRIGDPDGFAVHLGHCRADGVDHVTDGAGTCAGGLGAGHAVVDLPPHHLGLFGKLVERAFDLLCRRGGLTGERLHFLGHDGEAAAGRPGARRFDRRVQRQQVGLASDRRNLPGDLPHLLVGHRQGGKLAFDDPDGLDELLNVLDRLLDAVGRPPHLGDGGLGDRLRRPRRLCDVLIAGGDCPRGLAELGAGPYLGLDLVADRFDMAGDISDLNPKLSGFFGDLRDGTLGDIRHDEPPLIAAPPTSGPVYRTSVALVISPGLRNL